MTFHETTVLISLGLTLLTILSASLVVYLFWHPFTKAVAKNDKTSVEWMLVGITLNFLGAIVDNSWWGIAWTLEFLAPDSHSREFFFENGSFSNIFFRQICGILAAYCHLKAAQIAEDTVIKKGMQISVILSILFAVSLFNIKGLL